MVVILNILIALCLVSGFALMIYTGLIMPKRFFRQTGNTMQFRCLKCKMIHTYSNEETIKIRYKPRNMIATKGIGRTIRKISYQYFCHGCNEKTMQEPIGEPYSSPQLKQLRRKSFLSLAVIIILMVMGMVAGIVLDTIN